MAEDRRGYRVGDTGRQEGLYAHWRNGAKVVDANAFRALVGTA